jgi:hypothetical protein
MISLAVGKGVKRKEWKDYSFKPFITFNNKLTHTTDFETLVEG